MLKQTFALFVLAPALAAQAPSPTVAAPAPLPRTHVPQPTKPAITAADLMTRLYIYSDDSMMGRAAGTPDNLRSTAYIADQVKRMGLQPAGDSGGYFQWVPLVKRTLADSAPISVDGTPLKAFDDFLHIDPLFGSSRPALSFDGATAVYAGTWGDSTMLPADQAAGKLLVINVKGGDGSNGSWIVPPQALIRQYAQAAGFAVVNMEYIPPQFRPFLRQSRPTLKRDAPRDTTPGPATLFITKGTAQRLLGTSPDSARVGAIGKTVHGALVYKDAPAPARNVVAILPGSDPKLKTEYVAIGAHNDHIGFNHSPVDHDSLRAFNTAYQRLSEHLADSLGRPMSQPEMMALRGSIHVNVDSLHRLRPARLDSIANGADDDGSGTVTVLEIAEQFAAAKPRPKRSLLFVWHTGEELGLFGSQWFTDHPTVPRDSIVSQLNMDMVGRGDASDTKGGGPNYLMLIGSRRLSTELGDIVEAVNKTEKPPLQFDYSWDANGHPENVYCRSDHYEYARYGIPIVFFTTGLHQDYHQVTDEPQYIDYDHMARVGQLVHDVALSVANLDHRVVVDKPKPDPNAPCRQ